MFSILQTKEVTEHDSGGEKRPADVNNAGDGLWVAVEPKEEQIRWRGANAFSILCYKDAFSVESDCKFAFCPKCQINVREVLLPEGQARSRRCTKNRKTASVIQKTAGGSDKEIPGGICGKHRLKDFLTLDHVKTDSGYLKIKNTHKVGSDRIVTHCGHCGIKF